MTKCIYFTNPGALDINLVKLMGVSVKEGDNPIGFFGTGLKYAIAATQRLGGRITIFSEGVRYVMAGDRLVLRDKEFTRVTLNGEPLGFTTDLGKQWEPWMVVRELYSNCLDENGMVEVVEMDSAEEHSIFKRCGTETLIKLEGEAFLQAWTMKDAYFLNQAETPTLESSHANVYPHRCGSKAVFYRGIRVHETQQPTCFRYNLQGTITLTEDRTIKYAWELNEAIEKTIITSDSPEFIARVLAQDESSFEGNLTFSDSCLQGLTMSEAFQTVCAKLAARKPQKLNMRAIKYYENRTKKYSIPHEVEISAVQKMQLKKAMDFIKKLGFADELDDYPIKVVNWLGEDIYGQALNDEVLLTKQAFDLGTHKLAAIVLEEFVHLHYKLFDETRAMQSWLFERVITMGEEFVIKEPL